MKEKKESVIAIIISGIVAFFYVSGIPSILLVNIKFADVDPEYIALLINIVFSMIVGMSLIRIMIPKFEVGFQLKNFKEALKKYSISCFLLSSITFIIFFIGLYSFDYQPTIWKILVEGTLYYIGVGVIEEFFCRGLLQNAFERLFYKRKNVQMSAVFLAAFIFGIGHVFGVIGMPILFASSKIVWTIGMGIYFGAIYIRTKNLWLVAFLHFLVNFVVGIQFCFSTQRTFPEISTIFALITFLGFGIYGIYLLKHQEK